MAEIHDPGLPTATAEDEEKEPAYRGFFTAHRSADFMFKICFTLVVFVIILVLTSLHITRKKYRLPNVFRAARIRRALNVFKLDALSPQLPALQSDESLAVVCPTGWLIMHRMSLQEIKLPIQTFSCAPNWLREKSFGVFISRSSPERRILSHLVDYAFHDLPTARIESVVEDEVQLLLTENLNLIDGFRFDDVARRVAFSLVLNMADGEDDEEREAIRRLRGCVESLRAVHFGTSPLHSWDWLFSLFGASNAASAALSDSKRLLERPIRMEMEGLRTGSEANFLQTFIAARMELEEDGDQTSFLTVAHLAHAALDSLLVMEEILVPAFRWTLLILGHRADLANDLRKEAESLDGRVGPRARAFALEVIRWTQIGSHLSPVQLLDDWYTAQHDFPTGSVLFYDMRSASRDPQLWNDADCFRPSRFAVRHESGVGWTAKLEGGEAAIEALLDASGWGSTVPTELLIHIMAAGASSIASLLRLRVEGNEDFRLATHSMSRMPSPFNFFIRGR